MIVSGKKFLASNSPPDSLEYDLFDNFHNAKAFDTVLT